MQIKLLAKSSYFGLGKTFGLKQSCQFLADNKDTIACLLNGKGPVEDLSAGRRKKRSTQATEIKYGCPENFTKVSEDLCLHYHEDSTGQGIASTFDESKAYCQKKDNGASLFYFLNSAEASKVWEWLGKYQYKF